MDFKNNLFNILNESETSNSQPITEATTDVNEVAEDYKKAYNKELDLSRVPCVIARDTMLSGWGGATGKNHYQVVLCGDVVEAANIEHNMKQVASEEGLANVRRAYGVKMPSSKSVSYVVGRYAPAWNGGLSDSWYENRFGASLTEDDRIMNNQDVIDVMNSYSSRNNHLKYKIEGNSAIYEDGTEIKFILNDESNIEYVIIKDGKSTNPELAQNGLKESVNSDLEEIADIIVNVVNDNYYDEKENILNDLYTMGGRSQSMDDFLYNYNITALSNVDKENIDRDKLSEIIIKKLEVNECDSSKLNEDYTEHRMKDCTDDVDIINALEGDVLVLEDIEDWNRLKVLVRSLAPSQGFYSRLYAEMDEYPEDQLEFPMSL